LSDRRIETRTAAIAEMRRYDEGAMLSKFIEERRKLVNME
jgi:hypothetical protein